MDVNRLDKERVTNNHRFLTAPFSPVLHFKNPYVARLPSKASEHGILGF